MKNTPETVIPTLYSCDTLQAMNGVQTRTAMMYLLVTVQTTLAILIPHLA